jgi:hypothetical protein
MHKYEKKKLSIDSTNIQNDFNKINSSQRNPFENKSFYTKILSNNNLSNMLILNRQQD